MKNDLNLPSALRKRFNDYQRELNRQLQDKQKEVAGSKSSDSQSKTEMSELERRVRLAERHKNTMLMVRRKATFGEADFPICPICLINYDNILFLDENGKVYSCSDCDLTIEAQD